MISNKFLLNLIVLYFTTFTSQYVISVKILIIVLHLLKLHKYVIEYFRRISKKQIYFYAKFNLFLFCKNEKKNKILKNITILSHRTSDALVKI